MITQTSAEHCGIVSRQDREPLKEIDLESQLQDVRKTVAVMQVYC